jgi:hypothetical protein
MDSYLYFSSCTFSVELLTCFLYKKIDMLFRSFFAGNRRACSLAELTRGHPCRSTPCPLPELSVPVPCSSSTAVVTARARRGRHCHGPQAGALPELAAAIPCRARPRRPPAPARSRAPIVLCRSSPRLLARGARPWLLELAAPIPARAHRLPPLRTARSLAPSLPCRT